MSSLQNLKLCLGAQVWIVKSVNADIAKKKKEIPGISLNYEQGRPVIYLVFFFYFFCLPVQC